MEALSRTGNIVLISIIVAVVILVAAFFVFSGNNAVDDTKSGELNPPQADEDISLGGQLYEQSGNPAQDIPETNPFSAGTNPFSKIKTNPFE